MKGAVTTFSLNEIHDLLGKHDISPDSTVGKMIIAFNFERMPAVLPSETILPDEKVFVETKEAIPICPLVFGLALELKKAGDENVALAKENLAIAQKNLLEAQKAASVKEVVSKAVTQLRHRSQSSAA